MKLASLVFVWAYCHHFCAGIRYLFLDLDKGVDLETARLTSWIVLAASLALTALLGREAVVRAHDVVVGAHYGLRDWLAQRITAVIMAVYSVIVGRGSAAGKPHSPTRSGTTCSRRAGCASRRCSSW